MADSWIATAIDRDETGARAVVNGHGEYLLESGRWVLGNEAQWQIGYRLERGEWKVTTVDRFQPPGHDDA